jgi:hypothetical protein
VRDPREGWYGVCRRGIPRHTVAAAPEQPRLRGGALAPNVHTPIATIPADAIARTPGRHDGRRVALLGALPIRPRTVLPPRGAHRIAPIALHAGAAGPAPSPWNGVGPLFVEAPWRALVEEDAAQGRQHSRREGGRQRRARRTERPWAALLPRRHGLRGVQPLMQRWRRPHGLGGMVPAEVTEPSEGHGGVVEPGKGHQGKNILPRALAAGPWDTMALSGQRLSAFGGERASAWRLDVPRTLLRLSVSRHEESPSR